MHRIGKWIYRTNKASYECRNGDTVNAILEILESDRETKADKCELLSCEIEYTV